MSIGISGMDTARSQLDAAGHNLTNADTTGFKAFRAILGDVYAMAEANAFDMCGVNVITTEQQFTQGQLTNTGNPFDLGIHGKGFFVLDNHGEKLFSRSGIFHQDNNNQLLDPNGFILQGFNIDHKGVLDKSKLIGLQVTSSSLPGSASTGASAELNLNADIAAIDRTTTAFNSELPSTYHSYSTFNLYDSLGAQHTLGAYFTKTLTKTDDNQDDKQWEVTFRLDQQAPVTPGHLTFGTTGQLSGEGHFNQTFSLDGTEANDLNLTIDLSGATQFASDFSFRPLKVDGQMPGNLNRIFISADGFLEASYSNGQRKMLGQVALATFPSEYGLIVEDNNCWRSSISSGDPLYTTSGMNGAGIIKSGALEQSNVELSTALADVIVAQRNFQVSAKAFKAEDTLSQTLINLT